MYLIIIKKTKHVPKSVETSQEGKVTISWNKQVHTDRTIPNNKPDIIICDSEKAICMLIDIHFQETET
jgi:hypothetical protein